MKTVAQYAFTGASDDTVQSNTLFEQSQKALTAWLHAKRLPPAESGEFSLLDGRKVDLQFTPVTCRSGVSLQWTLAEMSGDGRFATTLALANSGPEVAFTCMLSSGAVAISVAPGRFTARCPEVVRNILKLQPGWRIGDTLVPCAARRIFRSDEATWLVSQLLSPCRTLPIVVVSRWDGLLLHPKLADILAADICGLGIVVDLDTEAAWETTHQLGQEWSCYNGAIRIYWPHLDTQHQNPRIHPLWTSERLMFQVQGTEDA